MITEKNTSVKRPPN